MKPMAFFLFSISLGLATLVGGEPERPLVTGIAFVRFYTTNIVQSRDFYTKTLGFDTSANCPASESSLCIAINGNQELRLSTPGPNTPANLIAEIGFAISDIPAMRRYLLTKDLQPTSIYSTSTHSSQFSVSDPEGHKVTFVEQSKGYALSHGPDPRTSQDLIHAGFVVRDRAAQDHFYKDILGFRPYWHGGMKDNETSWVAMQVPDGTDWVEYMLNISHNADKHTLGVMNHIALGVPDIHAAQQQLIKNGWKPGEEPKLGRDGKWQLNLYDPDDTRVEFMEFKPAEKPCCSEFTGPHPGPHQ
jgi:catechol 2,3-dioxygenase-like lactoylglutathione lyase family enzyme